MGLDGWTYEAIEVPAADFHARTTALGGEGFVGANVTIPHKAAALAIADHASPAAKEIGAANTLTFKGGEIHAENTDAPGLLAALPEPISGRRALVLGAGGAARASVWGLSRRGARVEVWNRTGSRADDLARRFGVLALPGDRPPVSEYELIVNATSLGLEPGDRQLAGLGIEPEMVREEQVVVDFVYRGGEETELVRVARRVGATVVDGFEVLARQGAESLHIWTGRDPPLDVMLQAARGG
jgi:shikimate dehydrogenase